MLAVDFLYFVALTPSVFDFISPNSYKFMVTKSARAQLIGTSGYKFAIRCC